MDGFFHMIASLTDFVWEFRRQTPLLRRGRNGRGYGAEPH